MSEKRKRLKPCRGAAIAPLCNEKTEVLGFGKKGRRVQVVETTRGDFAAAEVVLCSGAWSPGVARGLGLSLPVQPAKGYSVTVHKPSSWG